MAPGSSCFPSRGPAEVRRVTERELVSPSVLRATCALIGWPEPALCRFLLGQEPVGREDTKLLFMGFGPHSLGYTRYL